MTPKACCPAPTPRSPRPSKQNPALSLFFVKILRDGAKGGGSATLPIAKRDTQTMTLPETIKAMVLTGHGGLDKYEWRQDWPDLV